MVDALDLEQIQRFPDVLGRAFFTGVGDQVQAGPMGIGVSKDDAELRDAIQQAVQAAIDGGEIRFDGRRVDGLPPQVLFVHDGAYTEFADGFDGGASLVDRHPNVIMTRTFSKAYGLAGLRIGFAISAPEISDDLRRVATPFTVTTLAQQAAIASLAAEDELNERVNRIVAERTRVFDELTRQGWKIVPSQANFLWLVTGDDTDRIDEVMVSHGVFARCWSGEGIRLSIGLDAENDRAIEALSQAVKG